MKRTIQKHALVAALWSLAFTVLPVHAADDAAQLQQGKVLYHRLPIERKAEA